MKIVFLQDDFPPLSFGGAGFSTFELALGAQKAGHDVTVVTTCRNVSDAGMHIFEGLRVFKIVSSYPEKWRAYKGLYNYSTIPHVEKILQTIKPDVVHINNIHLHLSYHCFVVSRRYARVVVFTARDTMSICFGKLGTKRYLENFDSRTTWLDALHNARKGYNPLYSTLARWYIGRAHKRYAVSASLQQALVTNGITDVSVMHTGIDVAEWSTTSDEKNEFKTQYGIRDKKILLFTGRLSAGKGGGQILEAFARVSLKIPDAVLVIVGGVDRYALAMEAHAKTLGIHERIVNIGWVDRRVLRVVYAAADVVLVPSLYLDPFPRAVLEAMASQKPVIGSCYGGASEVIEEQVTGYVVNPKKQDDIASRSIELLGNSERAQKFGLNGYERIKKYFNLEKVVQNYITEYGLLMERTK